MSKEPVVRLENDKSNDDSNVEEPPEKIPKDLIIPKKRILRMRRYNENNEIERLLLHNSVKLSLMVDHCDFPAFNQGLWPQANQDNLKTYPSCAFSVPRPIHASEGQLQKMDLCYKRPHNRDLFKKRMFKTRSYHQTFMNSKKNKVAEKEGKFHRAIFDFAERIHSQPDPYFRGNYDYYYSGGNLCTLSQSGYVVHISGERLQTLGMRKVFLCKYLNAHLNHDIDDMDDSFSDEETPAHQNAFPIRIPQVKHKRKRLHMGRWQKSFATLSSYKDALVPDLLSIWDIEIDEDINKNGLNKLQMELNIKSDSSVKVRNWLDTDVTSDQPMIRIPSNIAINYMKQTVAEMPEQMQRTNLSILENNTNLTQVSVDFENAIQSTQIMENSFQLETTAMETQLHDLANTSPEKTKSKKKKQKKYVKGF